MGSALGDFELKSGPPMLRMIFLQTLFHFITQKLPISKLKRAGLIFCVCIALMYHDLGTFLAKPNPNVYKLMGVTRHSDEALVSERLDLAIECVRAPSHNETVCEGFDWHDEQRRYLN